MTVFLYTLVVLKKKKKRMLNYGDFFVYFDKFKLSQQIIFE